MWRFLIGITLLLFVITGCQSNNIKNIEEVINKHGDNQNLEGLNTFVKSVNSQKETKINYVQYGIEGQRGVMTLNYNEKKINVSHRVDGDFIEEYNCKNIKVETEADVKKYILSQCSGDFNGDFELLSIPNNEQSNKKIDNKDVREVVWDQLSSQQKKQIDGTWQDAKVSKVILNKNMMTLVKDKSYEGKEVYLIDFPTKFISKPNNMIVYTDVNTLSYIGNGLVE